MFAKIDTRDAKALATEAKTVFDACFPGHSADLIDRLFVDVDDMFKGRYLDYQALDLGYHDFEHTLQATLCLVRIFEGRRLAGCEPSLGPREFEIALAAALLHDTGYLRLRSDNLGTSAKYTHAHVLRSGAFAASYLPVLGFNADECDIVTSSIHCTGRHPWSTRLHSQTPKARLIACMLVTADYLGQMAAPDYPDELELLYKEIRESDAFYHIPEDKRSFISAEDLIGSTPLFWHHHVLHTLERDYDGMHQYLARPYPQGPNEYLQAVEANIAHIGLRISDK